MPTLKKINICGVSFDNIVKSDLRNIIKDILMTPAQNKFIVTPNVDFIVRAHKDEKFRNLINKADLSLCDSAIVKMASKFLRNGLKEKITGTDLLHLVCQIGEEKNIFFVLGSTEENIKKTVAKLRELFPDIRIGGFHHGYFGKDEEIIQKINSADTDILIIGMGSPKQEFWVGKNRELLNVKIIMCVGGLLDVLAEKVKRAPVWMQRIGLEWFWRLIHEPRRLWKRYIVDDMKFFYLLLKQIIIGKS